MPPRVLSALLLTVAVATPGCEPAPLPPFPEAVVVVDTDVPTLAVSALRVDLFDDRQRWFGTSSFELPAAADWPASFSVYSEDETRETRIWVRLRGHASGRVRDYRGERFRDWNEDVPPLPAAPTPRLVHDGRDETPTSEPEPLVTIDRLVPVTLRPGERRRVEVTLHGACAGTMVRFGKQRSASGPITGEAETCFDVERARTPADREATRTATGSAPEACDAGARPAEGIACVSGGVTVLGASGLFLDAGYPTTPERIVRVSTYYLDRNEVTVARYRSALARGFTPTSLPPIANEAAFTGADDIRDPSYCTWSETPLDRESMPLNCIGWAAARQVCRFFGGDLPTELQWEFAATTAGKPARSDYPWGNGAPDCRRSVWGRAQQAPGVAGCPGPRGPASIAEETADVTPLGIVGLATGVSEWTLDHDELYDSACWLGASYVDPSCQREGTSTRMLRGGAWSSRALYLRSARRFPSEGNVRDPQIGFRCAYTTLPEGS